MKINYNQHLLKEKNSFISLTIKFMFVVLLLWTTNSFSQVLLTEDFEGGTFPPSGWSHSTNTSYPWAQSTSASGYGIGNKSAWIDFYDLSSGNETLTTIAFSAAPSGALLQFDEAYATYPGNYDDQLQINYSTDGGATFNLLILLDGGTNGPLNTAGALQNAFVPNSNQWQTLSYSIPVGTNVIQFNGISAFGNNLFIDNIDIYAPQACSGTPNAGTTVSATNPIGANVPFVVSLSGAENTIGLTYQWQSSSDNVNYYDINGATSNTLSTSITADTWFQCIVTCSNSGLSSNSTPLLESLAPYTWTPVTNLAPNPAFGVMLLLSDGSVLCKSSGYVNAGNGNSGYGNVFNRLTPDANGSYINGTWSTIAPMHRDRYSFSSCLLNDGRLYAAGGEYGTDGFQNGSHGEIYDPLTDSWTDCTGPNQVMSDGDCKLLDDGNVLQAIVNQFEPVTTVIYDTASNTYITGPNTISGQNESMWLKLPDNSILFVDEGQETSERYIPSLNQWVADANVPVELYDLFGYECGPGFLLPDGRGFFIGSTNTSAFYTPSGNTSPGTWSVGPAIPNGRGMPDAPGAMMANGKILIACSLAPSSGDEFDGTTYFYEFDYLTNSYTLINSPTGGSSLGTPSYYNNMLDLPDGSVLCSNFNFGQQYYIYNSNGSPISSGKPAVSTITQTSCTNYTITGTGFNGISEGAAFGDENQCDSNYPIVRFTSGSNVYYARTFNWNSTGVQRGNLPDTTYFTLPAGIPNGTYDVAVVANGNASDPFSFTVGTPPVISCPTDITQNNDAGICSAVVSFTITATDPCPATVVSTPASGSIFSLGTTSVTSVATDGNGNTSSCSFNITVVDIAPPSITCAGDGTRSGNCSYTVSGTEFDPSASDNCGVSSLTYTLSGATSGSGSGTLNHAVLNLGVTTVSWTAADAAGNTASCSTVITVNQASNSLPYSEIFTTQDCWSVQHISGSGDWTFGNSMNTGLAPVSGEMMVFPSGTSPNGTVSRLISPLLNFTGIAEPVLNYHLSTDNLSQQPDSVAVSISTDGGNTYSFLRSALRKRITSPSWTLFGIDLAPYTNMNNIRLAFDAVSAGGGNDMAIDDVNLFDATCPEPVNFSSSNISLNSATVNWQSGGGTPSDFVVRWSTSISDLSAWNQVTLPGNSTNYTITGLAGNTTFYWQVKSDCSGNTSGFPITYQSFQTTTCPSSVSISSNRPNLYLCYGGTMTLTASSGFSSYHWSNSATTQGITISAVNTYSVTAMNIGCPPVNSSVIVLHDGLINLVSPFYFTQSNISCSGANNGIINVNPGGGFPAFTYSWSPNVGTTATVSNLSPGSYIVTVTDSKGCTNSKSTIISQPSPISLVSPNYFTQSNVTCFGGNNGIIRVNPSGGTPGYNYAWTPSEGTSGTISNLVTGTYTVTVTDAHLCTATKSTIIAQPTQILIGAPQHETQTNPTCANGANGIIRFNPAGGIPPYSYTWSPNVGTTATVSNLSAGTYYVTISDANGCTRTNSIVLICTSRIEDPNGSSNTSSFGFNVYPNPAEGLVTVAFSSDNEKSYSLKLIDMVGRVIKTEIDNASMGENSRTINLEGIAKGVYLIILQKGDEFFKSKLIVE